MNDINKTDLTDIDEEYLHVDPLEQAYRESISGGITDIQYLDAARGYGVFADAEKSGVAPESEEYYFKRLDHVVLPNVRKLQDHFRDAHLEVIHTRIMSMTQDGRERSAGHKRLNLHAGPGSKEAEFLPEVAPKGDEIVINKTASGVFNATNIEYILRNMGITGLFVCGVYTNECVSTTVRDACDRGFYTTLINDACATVTPKLHNATIETVRDRYARVMTTEDALKEIKRVV
ncbi:MAG: isochorismatase family cysteine hydrolase [Thioalkalispiraceae bacterium]|jgi:nicotinamidase-related amidase